LVEKTAGISRKLHFTGAKKPQLRQIPGKSTHLSGFVKPKIPRILLKSATETVTCRLRAEFF